MIAIKYMRDKKVLVPDCWSTCIHLAENRYQELKDQKSAEFI